MNTILGSIFAAVVAGLILQYLDKRKHPPRQPIVFAKTQVVTKPRNSQEAIGSLVIAIISLGGVDEGYPAVSFFGGLISIGVAEYALKTIRKRPDLKGGMYAIIGAIVGVVAIITSIAPHAFE